MVVFGVSVVLFAMSATLYLVAVIVLVNHGVPPLFTLGEVATMLGLAGMVTVPIFIVSALIQNWRETRKLKTESKALDEDNPQ